MKLDWIMLANHAEVAPNQLLYCLGGGWDTISVGAPIEGAPDGVFTVLQGHLVVRLLFHPTETGREHTFEIKIMGEDGQEIAETQGTLQPELVKGLPAGWLQNHQLVLPLVGIPLPREGNYVVNLLVNNQWIGDRQFRVLKGY